MEEEKIVEAGMEELDQIIEDYLKAKDTDYAIMINGDWGCGMLILSCLLTM